MFLLYDYHSKDKHDTTAITRITPYPPFPTQFS